MRCGSASTVAAGLKAGRRQFERWRRTRVGHSRIPDDLWALAVELAGVHGLCRTARMLRLDYNALKRHVASAGVTVSALKRHVASGGVTASRLDPVRGRKVRGRRALIPNQRMVQHDDGDFGSTTCDPHPAQRAAAMTFVELPPLGRPGPHTPGTPSGGFSPDFPVEREGARCLIELEDARGAKMRIHLTGHSNSEVVMAVSQVFLGVAS